MFLDRDGVLNEAVVVGGTLRSPRGPDDFVIAADARTEVARLRDAGYVTVVVSNQPDVARGLVTMDAIEAMHLRLVEELDVDAVYVCPHDNDDRCRCRKPSPGLLLDAAEELGISLERSWMIGDRWVDVAAGRAAGVRAVLLEGEASWSPTSAGPPSDDLRDVDARPDLRSCVDLVLGADPAYR